ncbi:unnamed protein product [Closterium sp. NIES-54]
MEHHITLKLTNLAKTRKEVNKWYLDSCCGQHMVSSSVFILNCEELFNEVEITVANSHTIYARSRGQIQLESHDTGYCIHISDVLVVPELQYNLLTLDQLMKCGVAVQTIENELHLIYDEIIGKATTEGGVFVLDFESPNTSGDNQHIIVLDPPGHPSPPTWSHPEETNYQRRGHDGTFRALAVPVASTTNPADTRPQAVEEGEEITSETIVATTETANTEVGGWARAIWPRVQQPTGWNIAEGWNTTQGWDAVDVRWIMENTSLGEAIAAETGWGNITKGPTAEEAEETEAAEEPEVTEEAPEAEEEESLSPHLIPITTVTGSNFHSRMLH